MKIDARDSRGQAFVLTVLFMVGLLGISALVLDVGSWFRASRASQAAADAALASMTTALEAGERDLEKAMTEAVAAARAAVSAVPFQPRLGKDPPSSTLVAAVTVARSTA